MPPPKFLKKKLLKKEEKAPEEKDYSVEHTLTQEERIELEKEHLLNEKEYRHKHLSLLSLLITKVEETNQLLHKVGKLMEEATFPEDQEEDQEAEEDPEEDTEEDG